MAQAIGAFFLCCRIYAGVRRKCSGNCCPFIL